MRKGSGIVFCAIAFAIALAGCSANPESPTDDVAMSARAMTISADLFYRERIALPPGAVAVASVEIAGSGAQIAESRVALAGRSVPVSVAIDIDRAQLPQDARLVFRGSIEVDGTRQWQSEPVPVDLASEVVDLERVMLRAAPALNAVDGTWVVEDIMGGGIIDSSRVTLVFSDGRVGGQASCNSFTAAWSMDGGRLSIGDVATTMMACPEALANQERRFLDALASADAIRFDDSGALFLMRDGSDVIRARRDN